MINKSNIKKLQNEVESELGVETVLGYKELQKFLGDSGSDYDGVENDAYRYWVFLNLVRATTEPEEYDSEGEIFFHPEGKVQPSRAPGVFVEPSLPVYPNGELWEKYQDLPYLKGPSDEDKIHQKPDMMLTEKSVGSLPFSAELDRKKKDKSSLVKSCARGEYERVAEKLGIENIPSGFAECAKEVKNHAEKETEYGKWEEFSEKVDYIIKCRNRSMTEEDYNRLLWYAIAYEKPILLFCSSEVTDGDFLDSIERIDTEVSIVDGFSVGSDLSECLNKVLEVVES